MFGSDEQQALAAEILQRGDFISLALTEKLNGSDMLATQTTATLKADGKWVINGEKWLINNLCIASHAVVFARTNPQGGPFGFGFFFVEMNQDLDRSEKIKIHGVRGMEMGAVTFKNYSPPNLSHFGERDGFNKALKLFQASRAMCSSLALGSVETSLRLTSEFALKRALYGKKLSDAPVMQYRLAESYARYQAIELVGYFGARALSYLPAEMSVLSAFIKYYVPTQCEEVMKELSVSFGARHFMRQGWYEGFFQKALRDVAVVSLFDGSTQVNLYIIANQLAQLLGSKAELTQEEALKVTNALAVDQPSTEPAYKDFQLTNRGQNSLVSTIGTTKFEYADELRQVLQNLSQELAADSSEVSRFELSERYCRLMAAIVVALGQHYHDHLSSDTFAFLMNLLLKDLGEKRPVGQHEKVFAELCLKVETDRNLGLINYPVAPFFNAIKGMDFA